ncbi:MULTISPECIES: SUMF1/EgtB/PvdO family nonheme iron enzyme [unclassified Nodularia (in: cyanobacteria)]|uniref:SUMF1/EgtB/PvdO family nonheme iron enzyme n=1 Tax=unclassified Nodularia (in: cyanobacteria) TaxID=2656917 RepID=UPI00187F40C2|nr:MULTISPECIES: SUMF1/EgtB/PvdO family nonheme iron enzyme [unclassified Nodularia (in: cyanobacteria)]MBE9201995.1 SUMF1/EgtB/PvdO family nonheme iron enzyme [Nodularia sp. LEGE 06071]MCC2694281.1 SUMF1/EgtB/PvdO family nonheme iron enzyme [Nodularia sp. LEGE 04288]
MVKNWAIAIGINRYDYLQPLNYAKRDAQLIQQFLQNQAGFEQIYFFSDDSPDIDGKSTRPNRANLLRVLRQLFENPFMSAGDNFWFFFSGHGIRHAGRDYLIPCDGDPEDIPNTAIAINYVTERLRRCGADNVVLMLDACRSLSTRAGEGIGRQAAEEARQQGVISIFSCSPQEYSYEIEALQQGAFTTALLEGLGIQGKCATVERLNQYLNVRVPEIVSEYNHGRQTPYVIAEPVNKSHLILVPQYATLADIATLKTDAYRAKDEGNLDLAEQLWIRVLAAALGQDIEAVRALQKIEQLRNNSSHPDLPQQSIPDNSSKGTSQRPTTPIQLKNSSPQLPIIANWSRRRIIQTVGMGAGGLGLAIVTPHLWEYISGGQNPGLSLQTFSFETVTVNAQGKITNRPSSQAEYFVEDLGNGITLEMMQIPGGTFTMGSPVGEEGRLNRENPQRQVTVPGFFMGKYQVTQSQYQAIMGENPAKFKGDKRPVELVNWNDAVEFCQKLSEKTGKTYRLPSEAEWEYACRAGTATPFYFGETITTDLANYRGTDRDDQGKLYPGNYGNGPKGEFREMTTPVGQFPPNSFGLYDMHGNVWEWCQDTYKENYEEAPTDGSAYLSSNDNNSMLRGGSWYNDAKACRSAARHRFERTGRGSNLGFRLVCVVA